MCSFVQVLLVDSQHFEFCWVDDPVYKEARLFSSWPLPTHSFYSPRTSRRLPRHVPCSLVDLDWTSTVSQQEITPYQGLLTWQWIGRLLIQTMLHTCFKAFGYRATLPPRDKQRMLVKMFRRGNRIDKRILYLNVMLDPLSESMSSRIACDTTMVTRAPKGYLLWPL